MTRKRTLGSGIALVLAAACALGAAGQSAADAVLDAAEALFAQRHLPGKLEQTIARYETLLPALASLPAAQQAFTLDRLSQLYYELGTAHGDEDREVRDNFQRGKDFGLRALALNAAFARTQGQDFVAALANVGDPPALLWTANNWGTLLGFDGLGGVPDLGKVRAMYERCLAVDETYWGASCHNALGGMLASLPSFLGGDDAKARTHLDRAIEIAPDYLTNRVALAEYAGYAHDVLGNISGVADRALIERELNAVLAAPVGDWPFWNRQAKSDAQALLALLRRYP